MTPLQNDTASMDRVWRRLDDAARTACTPPIWDHEHVPLLGEDSAVCGLVMDARRQRIADEVWADLMALARARDVAHAFTRLDRGESVNTTENRAATHTWQRRDTAWLDVLHRAVDRIDPESFDAVVHIGIGGSYLGPRLVYEAFGSLSHTPPTKPIFFLTSCDGPALERTLRSLRPQRTLVVVASKSFSSAETILNWQIVRAWLGDDSRAFAATAQPARAVAAGVLPAHILDFPETIGGRFSLWSSVSLSLIASMGQDVMIQMMAGANAMDQHVRDTLQGETIGSCLPLRHALLAVWNHGVCRRAGLAVVPYDRRLDAFPIYAQQLIMESLGKPAARLTAPIVFGGTGTEAQHSFFQMLHQGMPLVVSDLIGVLETPAHHADCHHALIANLVAQADTLWGGHAGTQTDTADALPGGHPVTLIWMQRMDPRTLGALIAFYEHSVFFQAHLYGINPFDQPGVEHAKRVATPLAHALKTGITEQLPPAHKSFVGWLKRNPF